MKTPVCQEFWEAELVFVGRAERVTPLRPGSERTEFVVAEQLRGQPVLGRLIVEAHGMGGSCDRSFEQGSDYLVFAIRGEDGTLRVRNCSNTDTLARVPASDLAYARRALTTPADGSLSGVGMIVRKTPHGLRSAPWARARVTLRAKDREMVTQTDRRGLYRFQRVPPGTYVLETDAPAHLAPTAPASVVIGNGACAHRNFTAESR